ncbi:MAG: DUF4330 domain-containing protein [Clostridiales bacterium]|jgi:hypothetical protein|nr:DUF4330 domain-containing protein [Clostridiales bacterium]
MDKNGKLFGKVSIVDLVVALLILAIAAGSVWRFTSPAAALNQTDEIIDITIRIEGVRDFTLENYHRGIRVYDRQAAQVLGIIEDIRHTPFYETVSLLDGTVIWAPMPGRITIYLDIVAHGRVTPTAIYAEGTHEITAGSLIYINTKYVQTSGRIYSVDIR